MGHYDDCREGDAEYRREKALGGPAPRPAKEAYYECHITLSGLPSAVKDAVEELGWTFSAIDGDPNLGPGVKCYATRQYNRRRGLEEIKREMTSVALSLKAKFDVTRQKIELVVYDTRQK